MLLDADVATKELLKLRQRIEWAHSLVERQQARAQLLAAATMEYSHASSFDELRAMSKQLVALREHGLPHILAHLDDLMVDKQFGHALDEIREAVALGVSKTMTLQQLRSLLKTRLLPLTQKYSVLLSHLRFRTTRTRDPNCGCLQIAQLVAYDASGARLPLVDALNPGGRSPANEEPPKALDGNPRSKWLDSHKGALECRIAAGPSAVAKYMIMTANDCPERDPVRWVLEGRTSEGEPWRVVDDKSAADQPTPDARHTAHEVEIRAHSRAGGGAPVVRCKSPGCAFLPHTHAADWNGFGTYCCHACMKGSGHHGGRCQRVTVPAPAAAKPPAAASSSSAGGLAGDGAEQAKLLEALQARPEMRELEELVKEAEALVEAKEQREPIPLVPAVEPPVKAATVMRLVTPMDLPRELELVHVLNGHVHERVTCAHCLGSGCSPESPLARRGQAWADAGAITPRGGETWLFEGLGGRWHCFDSDMCCVLADAHSEGPGAVVHVVSEVLGDFEFVINLGKMTQTSVLTGEERRVMREGGSAALGPSLLSVPVPDGAKPGDSVSVLTPHGGLLHAHVPSGHAAGDTFHVRVHDATPPVSRQPSADLQPLARSADGLPRLPVISPQPSRSELGGAPAREDSAADPRIIEVRRGKSLKAVAAMAEDSMFMRAEDAEAASAAPPGLPVFTEDQLRHMSEEAQIAAIVQATEAQAAHATTLQKQGDETAGKAARRRRELLAAATPGIGVEARVIFQEASGSGRASLGGSLGEGSSAAGAAEGVCVVCRGTGKVCAELSEEQVAAAAAAPEDGQYDCQVCFGDGAYAISGTCGAHFFCHDCIQGTLKSIIEMGQFPAQCPCCRAEAGGDSSTNNVTTGRIDDESLSFLAARGVLSRDLLFRFTKAALAGQPAPESHSPFSACPAGCGQYYYDEHTTYSELPVKLGEFYNVGDALALRLGVCTCGAVICTRCKSVIPAEEQASHMCRNASAEADPATKALMTKIGKQCPGCGNFVQKTEGCNIMMCGTNAHGKVADALRNGGCAFIFDWSSMKACDDPHGYHDINGVWQRGKGPKTDRQILAAL